MSIEKVRKILGATNDGELLSESELQLVELASKGSLSADGAEAFERLARRVDTSPGEWSWLHGVIGITKRYDGSVYWHGTEGNCPGKPVAHFKEHEEIGAERVAVLYLLKRCRALEQKGFPVDDVTAAHPIFGEAPADTKWFETLRYTYALFVDENDHPAALVISMTNGVGMLEYRGGKLFASAFAKSCGMESGGVIMSRRLEESGMRQFIHPRMMRYQEFLRVADEMGVHPEHVATLRAMRLD